MIKSLLFSLCQRSRELSLVVWASVTLLALTITVMNLIIADRMVVVNIVVPLPPVRANN